MYATAAAKAAAARRCDVIHIHNLSQFVPIMRRINPDARIILHMHCNWLAQLSRKLVDRRLASADAIIGCSEHVTSAIRNRFPNHAHRCSTIFNGVDTGIFHASASKHQSHNVAVFVGRISPEKGLHVLLDAFRQVDELRFNSRLKIIGGWHIVPRNFIVDLDPDPVVRSLRRFYGKENYASLLPRYLASELREKVSFVGELPQERLVTHLQHATVLVAPSLAEAFGMPVVEAMAVGLPVVASRVGGLPEIVVDEVTGVLTQPADPTALAQSILRILTDRALARSMGEAGRERAVSLFTWDNTVNNLLARYTDITRGTSASPRSLAEIL